jgi:RNA polymerase sigma-70 factor, ECF subfamily
MVMFTDELQLIGKARAGDVAAFAGLVERHRETIHRFCQQRLRDSADSEDVTQEVFVHAYLRLGQLRDLERFVPWLRRIAANLCIEYGQRNSKPAVSLEQSGIEAPLSPWMAASSEEERSTTRLIIKAAFQRLSERNRVTAKLFYMDGYSHQEIAKSLGIPVGTVRGRLHHARQHLRKEMMLMGNVKDGKVVQENLQNLPAELPVLPLRNLVLFPEIRIQLFVGRPMSVRAIEAAEKDGYICYATLKNPDTDAPEPRDLFYTCTVGRLENLGKLNDGTSRIIAEVAARARIIDFTQTQQYLAAHVELIPEPKRIAASTRQLMPEVLDLFKQAIALRQTLPFDDSIFENLPEKQKQEHRRLRLETQAQERENQRIAIETAQNMQNPGLFADYVAVFLERATNQEKIRVLGAIKPTFRLRIVKELLEDEIRTLNAETAR